MKKIKLTLYFSILLLLCSSQLVSAQIAPGSALTDATDEAFLQSLFPATMQGNLLYNSAVHGLNISTFHALCDNQGPTIVLYKDSIHGQVFGGYINNPWTSNTGYVPSTEAFLFNLTNDFKLDIIISQYAQYCHANYFPTFGGGHDIFAGATFNLNLNYTNPHSYQDPIIHGQSHINGGNSYNDVGFSVIEVYAVSPATFVTWTGASSGLWNTPGNWSTGSVPLPSDNVIIPTNPSGGVFPSQTIGNIVFQNLTIEANASLSVSPGSGVIIGANGTLTNNGTLSLEADATGTAWLDDFTASNATFVNQGLGTLTVEQYVSTGAAVGQRMFGSPIAGGIVQGLDQSYASASSGQIIMSNCGGNVDAGSPYNNLFQWQENLGSPNNCAYESWMAIPQSTNLEAGRGYSAWMQSGSVISFTGVPNTGLIQFNGTGALSNTNQGLPEKDGWHVLSNPYPSSVNINSLLGANWSSPQTYDASQAYAGTFQPILPGQDLGIAQGFVMKTNAPSSFVITNAERTQGSNNFKSNSDWYDAKLDIAVSNGSAEDITYIYFNEEASNGFDPQWDCEKRNSDTGIPTLYTHSSGIHSSLNGNSIAELGDYSFPMGLKPGSNGTFTFTVEGINTLPASTLVYLEDKASSAWTNLREQNTYTFNMTSQEAEDRFEIHFTKPIALNAQAESCEGNDGSITVDFGNQSINGNLQLWNYELRIDNQSADSGSEANMLELIDLESGDYEIIFTNGNLQISEWVTVEDKVQVNAEFMPSATELFTGEELVLTNTSTDATAYVWEINNEVFSTPNLSYAFEAPGTYVIRLSSSNADCEAWYEETIIVNQKTTSIMEQSELENVMVYTKDKNIIVDLSNVNLTSSTKLEVYDLLGKLVNQKLDAQSLERIEMANEAKGYYFVNIINQEEKISKKVIIK